MYEIKNSVFSDLTKRQKSALCNYLRSFIKNCKNLNEEEILHKFVEDEEYYHKIENPHFYFVVENFENEIFMRDLKKYINAIFIDLEYKEKQKPYIEEQKKIAKEQRKKAAEYKMKREKPTLKQLKYYTNLCKNHKIEPKNTQVASKFDLKTWISEILEKNE